MINSPIGRHGRRGALATLVLLALLLSPTAAGAAWQPDEVFRGALSAGRATADDVGHLVYLPFREDGSIVQTYDARTGRSRTLAPGGACSPAAARAEVALVRCAGSGDAFVTRLDSDEAIPLPDLGLRAITVDVGRRWVLYRECQEDDRTELACGPRKYVDWRTGQRAGPYQDDRARDLDDDDLGRVRSKRSSVRQTRGGRLTVRTAGGRSKVLSRRCPAGGACRVASTPRNVVWLIGRDLRSYDIRTGRRREARLPITGDGRRPLVVNLWATRRAAFLQIVTGVEVPTSVGALGENLLLAFDL